MTHAEALAFAGEWVAAWNAHDLGRILAHYADDFEMTSPYIATIAGEPSGTLRARRRSGPTGGRHSDASPTSASS